MVDNGVAMAPVHTPFLDCESGRGAAPRGHKRTGPRSRCGRTETLLRLLPAGRRRRSRGNARALAQRGFQVGGPIVLLSRSAA
jgi:hypothetical protein